MLAAVISELKTFITVCKHGTFAAAGDRIGLTQSAVSSQIKRLEETLGFQLFDRTGRSATLNAAGQATLPRAEEICALFSKLGELPDERATSGLLRVGSIASAQPTLLARALERLRGAFPLVRVHVSPGVSMHLMDDLDAGKIDAAVIIRPPFGMPPDLTWQALLHEPMCSSRPGRFPRPETGARCSSNSRFCATTGPRSAAGWSKGSCGARGWRSTTPSSWTRSRG